MTEQIYRLNPSLSDENFKLSCESVLTKLVRPDQSTIDLILKHEDAEKPQIILPDGQKFVWYFAIGSMINPISLYLRNITPLISYPARCPNYKLVFRGHVGMADIEACPDAEIHGVVHLLSDEQMIQLDAIEMGYNRIVVNSFNYQNQPHVVFIYKMALQDQSNNLPSERYLDIIVKGCEYFKVQSEYIDRLKEQAVKPRKQPHTFQLFTDIPSDVFHSKEELERHDGNDPSLPIWISINYKILEYTGLPPKDDPTYESHKRMYPFIKSKFAGREIAHGFARNLYDPLYKLPLDDEDLCAEQRAAIEDDMCSRILSQNGRTYWKPIGRLRTSKNTL